MAANKWQQTEEMAKKHDQGSSTWLKLGNDGDKAVVVFLGEPFPREVCFVDGKYMPCQQLADNVARHPEWDRILFPEKYRPRNPPARP